MVVDGRRSMSRRYDSGETKKGPWKAEEDEVLINHVKKYGPRDWSSIRSKGLLQRTGKSCRLRWVNKLRPNLKSGVKFTADEERIVIELQAQFGNKWAKIATYLSGRTDNDVKNFWSSRQKRLARILQNSSPSSSKLQKNTKDIKIPTTTTFHAAISLQSDEGPKFCSSMEDEMVKSQSCSSSNICHSETLKLVPLPELVYPNMLTYEHYPFQLDYFSPDTKPFIEPQSHISFLPAFPQLQPDFSFPLESQEFATRVRDPNFVDIFEYMNEAPLVPAQHPTAPPFLGPETSSQMAGNEDNHIEDAAAVAPDIFFDDFPPIDMFDQIETLPSPSEWS